MSIKRPIGWMALVLALVLPQLVLAQAPDYAADFVPGRMDAGPPLLGSNSVSNLELQRQPDGRWKISFDYFFTGAPPDTAVYVVQSASTGVANQAPSNSSPSRV